MAQVVRTRSLAGPLAALQQIGALLALGLLPAALAVFVIGGAIGHQFAFDFHGVVWQSARDVAHGHDPYPPATAAGVAPGNPFVYPPAIAFVFVPLGLLPFPVAAALITIVLLAAVAGTLLVLDVRDWRCYGAAYLSIPVLHDVRLGALTPLLALGVALAWRWRDRPGAAIPVAFVVVAKLFLWPLGVWLLATGRLRIALRSAIYGVAATVLAWLAIGFAGLADYPKLLRVLSSAYEARGYSPVAGARARPRQQRGTRAGHRPRPRRAGGLRRRGASRRRRRLARACARGVAPAHADRVAALLRAAARPDRHRAAHVLAYLADARALLDHAVRGELRRALAHRSGSGAGRARARGRQR